MADKLQKEITEIQREEVFALVDTRINELVSSFSLAKDLRVQSIQAVDYHMRDTADIENNFLTAKGEVDEAIKNYRIP